MQNDALFKFYEDHIVCERDISRDIAKHMVHTYGTSALRVLDLGLENEKAGLKGTNVKIHHDYPFLKSEISYSAKFELAQKPNDIICRRVPIAFLNKAAAESILDEVIEILAIEQKWSSERKKDETKEARELLSYLK